MAPVMGARDWLLLITLSLLWGGAFFLVEVALVDLPPFTVVLARIGLAAPALLAFVYMSGARMPRSPSLWAAFFVMGFLNNLLPFSLIVWGQSQITGSLAAILNATTPLFSVVLAHFLTGDERATANRVAGLLIGVAGVALLIGPDALRGLGLHGLAQLAVLAAACSYACAAIYGRRFRGLAPSVTAAGQVTCATVMILPIALVLDQPWQYTPGAITWGALLALSLLGTALAYLIYFRILASAGATNLMLVTFLIPISALALGVLILGEQTDWDDLAGLALILAGLAAIDGRVFRVLSRPRAAALRAGRGGMR